MGYILDNSGKFAKREKLNSLQALRALAFLGVFLGHTECIIFASTGSWGVSVFFVLSGFLMVYSHWDSNNDSDGVLKVGVLSNLEFAVGKIRRLYPLYILTMLLSVPFFIEAQGSKELVSVLKDAIPKVLANVFLVQAWIPDSDYYFSFNGVAWYLTVALFLYFMFPFVLRVIRKYKNKNTAIAVIVFTLLLQIVLGYIAFLLQDPSVTDNRTDTWFIYIFPLSRLEDFILGCNLGYLFLQTDKEKVNANLMTILEGFVMLILVVIIRYNHIKIYAPRAVGGPSGTDCWWRNVIIFTASTCLLVYLFAINKGAYSRLLTNKTLIWLGDLSAYAFLIHQPVMRYVRRAIVKVPYRPHYFAVGVISFAITIALSVLWRKIISASK